jgi:hypothetical protein
MNKKTEVADPQHVYRDLALQWQAAVANPKVANVLFRKHHRLFMTMKDTPEGRMSIGALLDDREPVVRLLAATHSLVWDSLKAVGVLENLERAGGRYSLDAKWTLRSFRDGTLDLEY